MITALSTPPSRNDPANFASRADMFLAELPTFAAEANILQADVNAKQTAAANSAANALASENAANAASNSSVWVSGTTYAIGNVRYSPINFLSYRRKTAGAGTTDPSADSTNWQLLNGTGNVDLTSTQTLYNKTITGVSYWAGNPIPIDRGGTGATTAANAFNALKQSASETSTGVVALAIASEVITGTDGLKAITPSSLRNGKPTANYVVTLSTGFNLSSIPSWVTRITLIATDISTSVASNVNIKLNGLGTGYRSIWTVNMSSTLSTATATDAFRILSSAINDNPAHAYDGKIVLERHPGQNMWLLQGTIFNITGVEHVALSGVIDLGSALTSISFTTTSGTFDGSANVAVTWE